MGAEVGTKISLLKGVATIVGSLIGCVNPKGVLENAGSVGLSLIIWVMCGLFSMIGAYCYAELITSVPYGTDYAYIFEAYGPFLAFLRLWVECIIVRPCSQAIVALTLSYYVEESLFPDCEQPDIAVRSLAVVCLLILMAINFYDVKLATCFQDVFTYAKLLLITLINITGIVQLCRGETEYFNDPFEHTETNIAKVTLGFYSGLFAYNGWNCLNYVLENLQDQAKNCSKAIWISISLVTLVYTFSNVSYFTTVSRTEVLSRPAVAVVFAQRLYKFLWVMMLIFVLLSTFGDLNGILLSSSRLFCVGARDGQLPRILSFVHVDRLTPMPACFFMNLLTLVYLTSSDMFALINYVSFVNWLAIGLSVTVLLYLRIKSPHKYRPVKVAIIWPIIYVVLSAILVFLPMYSSPIETGYGCLIIATGIPVYIVFVYWENKPRTITDFLGRVTRALQKLFMCLPEEDVYK